MSARTIPSRAPARLVAAGGTVFIVALAVAAAFDPGLRGLHAVQATVYVVAILLSQRASRWGYFLGISAAAFWNYVLLFVAPVPARFLAHPGEPDLVLQAIAWLGNAIVVVGGVWGFLCLPTRTIADVWRLVLAFTIAIGALALGMVVFSPERLGVLAQALHPHWP